MGRGGGAEKVNMETAQGILGVAKGLLSKWKAAKGPVNVQSEFGNSNHCLEVTNGLAGQQSDLRNNTSSVILARNQAGATETVYIAWLAKNSERGPLAHVFILQCYKEHSCHQPSRGRDHQNGTGLQL